MSNLALTPQWHDAINQVETTEKILGGASGNANLATKQLAENIFWLKGNTDEKSSSLQRQIDELPTSNPSDGFSQSLLPNGHCILPNGLIMQWGTNTTSVYSENRVNIDFPIAFPTACLNVTATARAIMASGDNTDGNLSIFESTLTGMSLHLATYYGDRTSGLLGFSWFAIGH